MFENKLKNIHLDPVNDVVYCIAWHDEEKWKEIEISADWFVYPCCVLQAADKAEDDLVDPELDALDNNWNNLKYNKLKDILNIWRTHVDPIKWKAEETCPECCKRCLK